MINYTTGDLFSSTAYALVNTVNTVGVMGKGVALRFKELFPRNYIQYKAACKKQELIVGKLLVCKDKNDSLGERLIINFPTKKHWRNPSQYSFIEEGLKDLHEVIKKFQLKEIAMPPLGCGNGGLDWNVVRPMIETALVDLEDVNILIYEPNIDYAKVQKQESADVKLTDARAMLLYALYCYEMNDERTNLVVANKLSYFYQLVGEKSFAKIQFNPYHYGPYSQAVGYVLKAVNGKYLHGLEQMEATPFEELELDYSYKQEVSDYIHKMPEEHKASIVKLLRIIDGFESTFAIEILATVAYIRKQNPGIDLNGTISKVRAWSDRKARLFTAEHIQMAYEHLNRVGDCICRC